ncbi:MAG: hypothetical protein IKP19_03345 [Oscillospiraceae bacterium]|nr:hypothetical protein [Oscillospiraceae bacterium]
MGMVLYWLLNERRTPFLPLPSTVKATTVTMEDAARKRRFDGEQIPPPAHGSKQLQAIVLRACAYDPKDRFASAAEMLEALKALKNVDASPAAAVPMGAAAAVAGAVAAGVAADELTTGTVGTVGRRKMYAEEEATIGAFGTGAAFVSRQQGQATDYQNIGRQNRVPGRVQPAQQGNRLYAGASAIPPQNNNEKKKKRGIGAWIAIAAGLVVVIGGVLLLTLGKGKDSGDQGDTKSALNNHASESTTTSQTEPGETLPVQLDWSEWDENLPDYVTNENYEIEELTLYSSKTLQTTSSTTADKLDGWELYETVSNGQWSQWSDWSDTQYTESDTRHVEAKKFYRYHDKQTTTSTSSSKSGWTLEGSTDEYGGYGSWSEWSKTAPSAGSNRKIETRYRYRTKVTSESNMPPDDGWEVEWVEDYTEPWSEWSDDYPSGPMMGKEVDDRQVETGKRYYFAHYCTGNVPGAEWKTSPYSRSSSMPAFDANCVYHSLGWFDSLSAFEYRHTIGSYDGYIYYPNGSRHECSNSCWTWYLMDTETTYKTQYCWRWHYDIYHIYKWGGWSSWSSDAPAKQSDREIEVQYRYCDREKTTVYSFYRWTDWSNWSEESEKETETHKGESKTFYRYQDRVEEPVYYFHRWTDWSDYSVTPVEENETTQVQTKKEYRYKSKE